MDSNRQYGKEVRILFSVLLKIPFRFACQTCPSFIWMYRTYEQYYSVNCGLFAVVWKWCTCTYVVGFGHLKTTPWSYACLLFSWNIFSLVEYDPWPALNDSRSYAIHIDTYKKLSSYYNGICRMIIILLSWRHGIRDIYYIHKARYFELGDPQINMQKNFETK